MSDESEEDPQHIIDTDPVLSQFQRSHSLPRNYGRRFNWRDLPAAPGAPPAVSYHTRLPAEIAPQRPPPPREKKRDDIYTSVRLYL